VSKDKFLTVFAVFDENTQMRLKALQDAILEKGFNGTQTMGIPFHISLGSFSPEKEEGLKAQILKLSKEIKPFDIELKEIGSFGNSVLFVQPIINGFLTELHGLFYGNYADGFAWHPHSTVFCGKDESVIKARKILEKKFKPITAKIMELHMCEFFPIRMIIKNELGK
jgi:2'-5' RNA ligase